MRAILGTTTLLLAIGGLSSQASAVCNIRGEFCGYPAWAANAFTHPRDRVPNWMLEDQARWSYGGERRRYYYPNRAKRYYYRSRRR
jgi:hypothetical protein